MLDVIGCSLALALLVACLGRAGAPDTGCQWRDTLGADVAIVAVELRRAGSVEERKIEGFLVVPGRQTCAQSAAASIGLTISVSGTCADEGERTMPSDVGESYACALVGEGASASTFAMGAESLVDVVAGGVIALASPGILILGVTGVVFAVFCTVSQAPMPAAVDFADRASGATRALLGALAAEQTDGMVFAAERVHSEWVASSR